MAGAIRIKRGRRMHRLVVLEVLHAGHPMNTLQRRSVLCRCDCGNVVVRDVARVTKCKFPSCGCASDISGALIALPGHGRRQARRAPHENTTVVCECGRRKRKGRECCGRCAGLDGLADRNGNLGRAEVIHAMRLSEWSSVYEVAGEAGMCERQALRVLQDLAEAGRVHRVVTEVDEKTGSTVCMYRLIHPAIDRARAA